MHPSGYATETWTSGRSMIDEGGFKSKIRLSLGRARPLFDQGAVGSQGVRDL